MLLVFSKVNSKTTKRSMGMPSGLANPQANKPTIECYEIYTREVVTHGWLKLRNRVATLQMA